MRSPLLIAAGLLLFAALPGAALRAEDFPQAGGRRGGGHGVYQRQSTFPHSTKGWSPRHRQRSFPQVSSFSFQRPYPYHLDYYRMRYGGSYAPYFGNQYGPPAYIFAPQYFGEFSPGYLPYGYAQPNGQAIGGLPAEVPGDYAPGPAPADLSQPLTAPTTSAPQ